MLNLSVTALSIEVAPRITDREIVEKLVSLEVGQDALGKRMDDMISTLNTLFIAVITLIVALFAFIAWDRRTMLKPVVDRLDRLLLNRLVSALRELAKDDEKNYHGDMIKVVWCRCKWALYDQ